MLLKLNESFVSSRILNLVSKENYWRIRDNYIKEETNRCWSLGYQIHKYCCYETR